MSKTYFSIIEQDDNAGYSAFFPDFDGCVSAGNSIEETIAGAHEALQMHIDGMIEDGEAMPRSTDPAHFVNDPDVQVACVASVAVNIPLPARRLSVTLPGNLVERIDAQADNRSGFLAQAAEEKLLRTA